MTDWLTEPELVELTGVPAEVLQRGIKSELFDGLVQIVGGERRYAADVAPLVAWSSRLGDQVVDGRLTLNEARRLLRLRARQLYRRIQVPA